jgi:hypothetical protein
MSIQLTPTRRQLAFLLMAVPTIAATPPALALTRGASSQGWAFLDGGVGRSEIESMEAERGKYSLWLITAARLSGAYLADVDISITNDKGAKVFERRLEGPWLMIDLPLGRYEVQARVGQESLKRATTIHRGDHHQMVFHFSVDADVLPK